MTVKRDKAVAVVNHNISAVPGCTPDSGDNRTGSRRINRRTVAGGNIRSSVECPAGNACVPVAETAADLA